MPPQSGKRYKIRNVKGGTVVDLDTVSNHKSASIFLLPSLSRAHRVLSVQGWSYHGGTNQLVSPSTAPPRKSAIAHGLQWDFIQQDANTWFIKNAKTGGYLAIKDGQLKDNNEVMLWKDPYPCAVFPDQHDPDVWRYVPILSLSWTCDTHGDFITVGSLPLALPFILT